ncbi:MAG: hypothetical protein NTY00_11435 [Deltaproteobacteria bacterium]|nr:hypothetical protein [Deltaproteobacteria bacterium]
MPGISSRSLFVHTPRVLPSGRRLYKGHYAIHGRRNEMVKNVAVVTAMVIS